MQHDKLNTVTSKQRRRREGKKNTTTQKVQDDATVVTQSTKLNPELLPQITWLILLPNNGINLPSIRVDINLIQR